MYAWGSTLENIGNVKDLKRGIRHSYMTTMATGQLPLRDAVKFRGLMVRESRGVERLVSQHPFLKVSPKFYISFFCRLIDRGRSEAMIGVGADLSESPAGALAKVGLGAPRKYSARKTGKVEMTFQPPKTRLRIGIS
jgi:hypothetical protein